MSFYDLSEGLLVVQYDDSATMVYSMLASMPAIIIVQSACKLSLHNVTICATKFNKIVHFAKLQM